jgi:hypothetical protein
MGRQEHARRVGGGMSDHILNAILYLLIVMCIAIAIGAAIGSTFQWVLP